MSTEMSVKVLRDSSRARVVAQDVPPGRWAEVPGELELDEAEEALARAAQVTRRGARRSRDPD